MRVPQPLLLGILGIHEPSFPTKGQLEKSRSAGQVVFLFPEKFVGGNFSLKAILKPSFSTGVTQISKYDYHSLRILQDVVGCQCFEAPFRGVKLEGLVFP